MGFPKPSCVGWEKEGRENMWAENVNVDCRSWSRTTADIKRNVLYCRTQLCKATHTYSTRPDKPFTERHPNPRAWHIVYGNRHLIAAIASSRIYRANLSGTEANPEGWVELDCSMRLFRVGKGLENTYSKMGILKTKPMPLWLAESDVSIAPVTYRSWERAMAAKNTRSGVCVRCVFPSSWLAKWNQVSFCREDAASCMTLVCSGLIPENRAEANIASCFGLAFR